MRPMGMPTFSPSSLDELEPLPLLEVELPSSAAVLLSIRKKLGPENSTGLPPIVLLAEKAIVALELPFSIALVGLKKAFPRELPAFM